MSLTTALLTIVPEIPELPSVCKCFYTPGSMPGTHHAFCPSWTSATNRNYPKVYRYTQIGNRDFAYVITAHKRTYLLSLDAIFRLSTTVKDDITESTNHNERVIYYDADTFHIIPKFAPPEIPYDLSHIKPPVIEHFIKYVHGFIDSLKESATKKTQFRKKEDWIQLCGLAQFFGMKRLWIDALNGMKSCGEKKTFRSRFCRKTRTIAEKRLKLIKSVRAARVTADGVCLPPRIIYDKDDWSITTPTNGSDGITTFMESSPGVSGHTSVNNTVPSSGSVLRRSNAQRHKLTPLIGAPVAEARITIPQESSRDSRAAPATVGDLPGLSEDDFKHGRWQKPLLEYLGYGPTSNSGPENETLKSYVDY